MTDDSNKRNIKIIITSVIVIMRHCKIGHPIFRKNENGTECNYLD
jgi:hypothetical protein